MPDTGLSTQASQVIAHLKTKEARLVTAESCTGGLIAATLTEIAGSSSVIEGGFVTYSNAMKIAALGVAEATLEKQGAVSEATAAEMAIGALTNAPKANIAVAVTGVAGPDGGSSQKPVGMVCIAIQHGDEQPYVETAHFPGDRHAIRSATVARTFELLLRL